MSSGLKNKMLKPVQDFMMSCENATYLLSISEYKKLSLLKRIHLYIHLLSCDGCKAFKKQWEFLSIILKKVRKAPRKEIFLEDYKSDIQDNIEKYLRDEKKN